MSLQCLQKMLLYLKNTESQASKPCSLVLSGIFTYDWIWDKKDHELYLFSFYPQCLAQCLCPVFSIAQSTLQKELGKKWDGLHLKCYFNWCICIFKEWKMEIEFQRCQCHNNRNSATLFYPIILESFSLNRNNNSGI